jgi:hypothetical protein
MHEKLFHLNREGNHLNREGDKAIERNKILHKISILLTI